MSSTTGLQLRVAVAIISQYVIDLLTKLIIYIYYLFYLILLICSLNRHYSADRAPVRVTIVGGCTGVFPLGAIIWLLACWIVAATFEYVQSHCFLCIPSIYMEYSWCQRDNRTLHWSIIATISMITLIDCLLCARIVLDIFSHYRRWHSFAHTFPSCIHVRISTGQRPECLSLMGAIYIASPSASISDQLLCTLSIAICLREYLSLLAFPLISIYFFSPHFPFFFGLYFLVLERNSIAEWFVKQWCHLTETLNERILVCYLYFPLVHPSHLAIFVIVSRSWCFLAWPLL